MIFRKNAYLLCAALAAAVSHDLPAQTQEIVIGHVAGLTGPVAKDANDTGIGAKVMIAALNARGGINGRKLRLLQMDDHYNPEETVKLVASMAGKVSALLPLNGSANVTRLLKDGVLDTFTLPIVGTVPSPDSLRIPMHKNIFHIRAGDRDQIEKIVELLTTVGITRICVVAPKNPFGEQGAAIVQQALEKHNLKLVATTLFDLTGAINLEPSKLMIATAKPEVVILLGPSKTLAEFIKELRERGETTLLYALSYADSGLIVKTAGLQFARGVAISQVMPNVSSRSLPLVKAFREDFEKYSESKGEPTSFNLEGYLSVRLIVEAIRKSKDSSAEGVKRGLEQLRELDLGGYVVDFSPTKHTGSTWVDLSMIGARGTLVY